MGKKTEQSEKSKDYIGNQVPTQVTQNSLQTGVGKPVDDNIQPQPIKKSSSAKQRKTCLYDYQQTFLSVPKITDRKTVFISNELRERIVSIVRQLGAEKSSVSGFIENLVNCHLDEYKDDIESWKKL